MEAVHMKTHLCPSNVRCDKELDVSMPKDTKNHAPEIPLRNTIAALKQLDGGILLAGFILGPCLSPVSACLVVFCVMLVLFPSLDRKQARKDKDWLDVKFFEGTKIRFNALG